VDAARGWPAARYAPRGATEEHVRVSGVKNRRCEPGVGAEAMVEKGARIQPVSKILARREHQSRGRKIPRLEGLLAGRLSAGLSFHVLGTEVDDSGNRHRRRVLLGESGTRREDHCGGRKAAIRCHFVSKLMWSCREAQRLQSQ